MKKLLYLLVIVTAFASCTKMTGPTPHRDRLVGLLLSGGDTLQMYVGETRQLPLTINPSDYHIDSIRWKSSDTTVLSISNLGLITAKKVGVSTVSVSNLTGTMSVSALITVGPALLDSLKMGVVAYYPFSGNAADSSGNGYNGTINGAVLTTNRFGKANSAYYFNGTSNISVNDATALRLNNTDFTVNTWVRLDDFNTSSLSSAVIDKRTTNGAQLGWYLGINGTVNTTPTGDVYYGPGGGFTGITSNNGIAVNTWTMVTAVYSLKTQSVKIYIDGVFSTQSQQSIATPDPANNANMYIGSDNPANPTFYYLKGSIDDIRIYNRGLSSHEIGQLFKRAN